MEGVAQLITKQKRTEAALQESEAQQRRLVECAPAAIAVFDADMRYLAASRCYLRDYGLDEAAGPEALTGRRHCEVFSDLPARWHDIHSRVLAGETLSAEEESWARADGRTDWVRWEAAPWRRADGTVGGALLVSEVVTARKHAEAALREREATLAALLDALPAGVVIADLQCRIVRDNAVHRELWGGSPDTAGWKQYGEWVGYWPATGKRIKAEEWAMSRALLRGEVIKGELIECDRFGTGERRVFLNNANPIRDEAGHIVGGVVAELDVTATRAAERALRESEARLRDLLATLDVGTLMARDTDGTIRFWSEGCERLYGWTAAEAVGRTAHALLHTVFPDPTAEMEAALLRHGSWGGDLRQRTRAGKEVTVAAYKVLRRDGERRPAAVFEALTEVTEQRRAEALLRQSEARLQQVQAELLHVSRLSAMGHMAAMLAHELNQPLTATTNYLRGSQRLLDAPGPQDLARVRQAVGLAADQTLRSGQIIRRLREFVSRGEADKRPESAGALTEEVSALALVGVKERGVTVRLQVDPEAPTIFVDKVQIQQVLLNLVRNAIEATCEAERREVALAVEADGGRIWTEPNPGGGTVFRFTVPAVSEVGAAVG